MRILFLIRSLGTGGAERAATALANAMSDKGHDVGLLVLTRENTVYDIHKDVTVRCIDDNAAADKRAIPLSVVQRAVRIRKILRETEPQILVGMSHTMSFYAAICGRGLPVRTVGTERANPYVYGNTAATRLMRRYASAHCDGFVCQTKKAAEYFPKSVQKRIAIIPNGLFNPLIENISVPNEREKTITAMGRLDQNKAYDVLLRAFAHVHKAEPEYRLTIFGEGPMRKALSEQAESLGVSDHFSLPGNDPDALKTIAKSGVFVLSSRSEGMPNALMEAMAVGVPCVSTRCEIGPQELIRDGENGLLVPVDDPDAIANAVLEILRHRTISEALSRNAYTIRRTHALDRIVDRWIRYFDTIL